MIIKWKLLNLRKFYSLLLYYYYKCLRKTKCMIIIIHKALFLNYEIHGPWGTVNMAIYCENVLNLSRSSSLLPYIFQKTYMIVMSLKPSPKIVKYMAPRVRSSGPRVGVIQWTYIKSKKIFNASMYIWEMHDYNVHKALYPNCEIYGPRIELRKS